LIKDDPKTPVLETGWLGPKNEPGSQKPTPNKGKIDLMYEKWLITASEKELRELLIKNIGCSFQIREEVKGKVLIDGTTVKIDFLMYPKKELIDRGFPEGWFGVEVKALGPKHETRVQKCLSLCWQCITYRWSEFDGIRPNFILMFPDLKKFFIERHSTNFSPNYIAALVQRGNVGQIHISPGRGWEFRFGSQYLFRSDKGLGNVKNLGLKIHIGTKK